MRSIPLSLLGLQDEERPSFPLLGLQDEEHPSLPLLGLQDEERPSLILLGLQDEERPSDREGKSLVPSSVVYCYKIVCCYSVVCCYKIVCCNSVVCCYKIKAIVSQNPKLSKEQRTELRESKGHDMTFQRYHRYADMLRYIEHLTIAFSHLVEVVTIGKTNEGVALKVVKVSSGSAFPEEGTVKPAVWIDGDVEGRTEFLQMLKVELSSSRC
uniref:Peptidase M14 domain-containing protein n=1 Tax=Timema tahoe TaxID=61484 RepID=A0A7R9IKZ8_9NEOP|nr:unnamed protein product [Timema tahoe]